MEITLYRGASEFSADLLIDEETGEIGGDFPLDVLVQRNPIGTCAYVLNTDAQVSMIDAHIKLMQAKKKALQNNTERARVALKQVMQLTGVTSIKSNDGLFKATLYKECNVSTKIENESQIPPDYFREIPATSEPDKVKIKKALLAGFDVPGATLDRKDRLAIA